MAEKLRTRTISNGDSESEIGHDTISDINSIMNSSQISNVSNDSTSFARTSFNITHNISGKSSCRFPKLEECAHFHYERVQLGKITARLVDEKYDSSLNNPDSVSQTKSTLCNNGWFIVRVTAGRSESFLIRRSIENLKMLDELLHQCVYDRKISDLDTLKYLDMNDGQLETIITKYLTRFSMIASDAMTCGPVLTWLQLDNKGRRLPVADMDTMKSINTPAVGAAYGVRRYVAQACDEISIEVGDMISVIDMPSPAESVWWRGKKSHLQKSQYEVGFFPQSCVATIGDKVPRHMPLPAPLVGSLAVSPTKPVLRKHGKLIAFFRSFILSRPSRRRLKQSGIYKERVFSCDLSEHLLNSGQDIPMVLKCCAEFIEEYGIVDGIYRLSGITSNIQKLRRAFDEERIPDLTHPEIKQDIHAVSSLLKMYFRELPNPLCTYQLYENFVDAIQRRTDGEEYRLKLMKETVQKLPPPHYRTLKYLSNHLNKISRYSDNTGMTDRNLAIVWAPNLLRSPALESGGVAALRGVGVQAVVTEYLITHCESIFNSDEEFTRFPDTQLDSLTDSDSFIEQREHDQVMERPKSLNVGGAKLLSIEEAQSRHIRSDNIEIIKPIQLNTSALQGGYIEVGGGPSSLPDKYHTVLPVPRSWQKRKTHSWKSLFSRAPRQSNSNHDIKEFNSTPNKIPATDVCHNSDKLLNHHNEIEEKENKTINSFNTSNSHGKLVKSDIFDGKSITTMDVCPRSSSIDSLKTTGHSRSVSHDSYFDLLQSPLRAMCMDNSREMSELGLNFDREEPEMRIFSESESLVSSPKIIKEQQQQPPVRRIMRARPEEYSSTANSVNPSPKKQPRLNLQSSNDLTNWINHTNEESSCKRYKLEDQLSDIQFIDCSTPEHVINNPNSATIYTSVQIHNPPLNSSHEVLNNGRATKKQQYYNQQKLSDTKKTISSRYSYPGNRNNLNKDQSDLVFCSKEGRFSYPIGGVEKKFFEKITFNDENIEEKSSPNQSEKSPTQQNQFKSRYNFFESSKSTPQPNEAKNDVVLRSSSAEMYNTTNNKNTMNRSKLSVATPQSPMQSPRYSLLVGETSSEASSSLNTPTYDNSRNSFEMNTKELDKMKNNMTLDLNTNCNKHIPTSSTPNTPSHTHTSDNTSQSMTPSEFGYHNLNRLQSVEGSPKSTDIAAYENLEQNFYENSQMKIPIKATINITYVSPSKKINSICDNVYEDIETTPVLEKIKDNILLETTFDDKMVYEQVKIFKSTITEVNELIIANGNNFDSKDIVDDSLSMEASDSVVPNLITTLNELNNKNKVNLRLAPEIDSGKNSDSYADNKIFNDDVAMSSDQDLDLDTQDSLEFDQHNISLYENVHVKQPPKTYENIELTNKQTINPISHNQSQFINQQLIQNDQHKNNVGYVDQKPGNFIVRQLATKFETSPVEGLTSFDFPKSVNGLGCSNMKKDFSDSNRNSPCVIRSKINAKHLNKGSKITRSLDENAFVREFGTKKLENINQSVQQIQDFENILSESRRKSMEFTTPKSLNPPKKLPSLTNNKDLCKSNNITTKQTPTSGFKLDLTKSDKTPTNPVRITPTTENRISLIQNNIINSSDDDKSSSSNLSSKVLENVKLDRERIEKIKEERRHQLNEKFRNESFRGNEKNVHCLTSKSKSDIRDTIENNGIEITKHKSKSRADIRNIADNNIMINQDTPIANYLSRIRRISDEKNQNEISAPTTATSTISPTQQIIVDAVENENSKLRNKLDKERVCSSEQETVTTPVKCSHSQRDKISPQRSIKDVAAMFESRMQNQ